MRVAVTGASGFIGSRLCERLVEQGDEVVAVLRRAGAGPGAPASPAVTQVAVGDLCAATDFTTALAGVEAVVHLAAHAHRGEALDAASRRMFWRVNVAATEALVTQAARAGVTRFVFMSSAKVHGDTSPSGPDGRPHAFSPGDSPLPAGPYGASKWAAEQALAARCREAGMALTILRPPLVYGPGQRGNLRALTHAIVRAWPLPFASIRNVRSLLYLEHLVDAIVLALRPRDQASRTYTLADCALSTPELVAALAQGLGRRARLVPCPVRLLRAAGALSGRAAAVSRLTDSLLLDSQAIERELGWRPRVPLAAAMADTGAAWRRGTR